MSSGAEEEEGERKEESWRRMERERGGRDGVYLVFMHRSPFLPLSLPPFLPPLSHCTLSDGLVSSQMHVLVLLSFSGFSCFLHYLGSVVCFTLRLTGLLLVQSTILSASAFFLLFCKYLFYEANVSG